ncbi:protein SLG1 [Drosophila eugracilis]|uniref:protein SLG1 n=1 Tax=Drosophila eugracilis TaxID=29029 RepID=UPI001BDB3056|nr:protein SLG1 [Drosophila eugracilis]
MSQRIENIVKGVVVVALAFMVAQTVSDCNVCQSNQVACINSTSFYLCFGDGTPHRDQLYHCLEGFDCTNLTAICVQKSSQRPPSCGDTSQCGQCNANVNYLFACQSRGIFQMCYGATRPTGKFGYCPSGTVCDASSNAICVPEVEGQSVTCDINDELVDTTTAASVTTESSSTDSTLDSSTESSTESSTSSSTESSTESTTESSTDSTVTTEQTTTVIPLTPAQMCTERNATGLFPIIPADPYCQRYISCYFQKNVLIRSAEYNCPSDSYFASQTQSCVYVNPGYCL